MSTKFKFLLAAPVKWPDRCAVCNKNPDEYNDLCGRALISTFWGPDVLMFFTLLSIRYPIKVVISVPMCRRHFFQMNCIKFLPFCFLVAMLLFAILTFAQFFDQKVQSSYFHALIYFFISIVSLVIYILSLRRQPIKLKEVGDIFYTIVIKDKDYAKEFALINDYFAIKNNHWKRHKLAYTL
jgi:hypothetical protein